MITSLHFTQYQTFKTTKGDNSRINYNRGVVCMRLEDYLTAVSTKYSCPSNFVILVHDCITD